MADSNKGNRGRPVKGSGAMQGFPVRLEAGIIDRLDKAAAEESRRGFNITRSDIVRRAIIDYLDNRDKGNV